MKYLTPQQVLAIHDQMVKRFGGSKGLRDIGLLESAVGRPQATYGGQDLYENVFDKGAALMHSLLKSHPFVDGNKRTAYTACAIFLEVNGRSVKPLGKEEVEFCLGVEEGKHDMDKIAAWLRKNSVKKK